MPKIIKGAAVKAVAEGADAETPVNTAKQNTPSIATTAVEGKDGISDVAVTLLDGPAIPGDYTGPLARVTVSLTSSVELAKFQYAKPMVMLEVPTHPARIDAAYAFAQTWVNEKLSQMVSDIMESVSNA